MKNKTSLKLAATYSLLFILLSLASSAVAQQCGSQAGGALCPGGHCCSKWGYCGSTPEHCGEGCQSQCVTPSPPPPSPPPPPPLPPSPPPPPCEEAEGELTDIINEDLFNQMLLQRNNPACPARGFYTFDAFVDAARYFPCFGTVGDEETRKREVASFLAQTSHETTGGWDSAPDGRFAWGYCFKAEVGATNAYCEPSTQWPCVEGKKYYGRGPIQLSYNYNYGQAGEALGLDLLSNPDLVETDPTVSFKTALWFWMTAQPPKPSCHVVMIGQWQPTPADEAGGRAAGYGLLTNIINGGLECNIPTPDPRVEDRIGFYKRYCDIFGIGYGENLDCYNQRPFNWGSSWSIM
ncbi:putative inactive chitinase-like protein LaCIC [Silene latifolia]|uniref:putative inactive chitinase-like protein LaCIC n=1 Tax=Silene latifolia TaxID=37657 RepID=UPI003D783918